MLHQAKLIDRIVEPLDRTITAEVARWLVGLHADEDLQSRFDELANLSTEGQISPEQLAEYDEYLLLAQFVATLQSRARAILAINSPS